MSGEAKRNGVRAIAAGTAGLRIARNSPAVLEGFELERGFRSR